VANFLIIDQGEDRFIINPVSSDPLIHPDYRDVEKIC
jgi:hypothetical protein